MAESTAPIDDSFPSRLQRRARSKAQHRQSCDILTGRGNGNEVNALVPTEMRNLNRPSPGRRVDDPRVSAGGVSRSTAAKVRRAARGGWSGQSCR